MTAQKLFITPQCNFTITRKELVAISNTALSCFDFKNKSLFSFDNNAIQI